MHWNLPHNPVDLEQREGRIHRYKGHAVRKNLASVYGQDVMRASGDIWDHLFEFGRARRRDDENDLVPFWVFRLDGVGAAIERHVPMFPLSRERSRFPALVKGVAVYRLAFGQPRQEDLVRFLLRHHDEEELKELVRKLRVDLVPPAAAKP